jgi:hypothetical protein
LRPTQRGVVSSGLRAMKIAKMLVFFDFKFEEKMAKVQLGQRETGESFQKAILERLDERAVNLHVFEAHA